MKFGRNLPRNQVPEWATSYIKYKALKKIIKSAAEDAKHGDSPDTAEFFYSLDRNLEDVSQFYNKKYSDAARRLKLLQDRYGRYTEIPHGIAQDELEDLMGALLELRGQLRNLKWYGEVNRRGFIKITKKLDKKVGRGYTQKRYLESKVDPKQFATNADLSDTMNIVNEWLSKLKDVKIRDDGSSTHSSHSVHGASSKAILKLPPELLDRLDQAIRADKHSALVEMLESTKKYASDSDDDWTSTLSLSLLQRAITCRAKGCMGELLSRIKGLDDDDDINDRNCIHRLLITTGRAKPLPDGESAFNSRQDIAINGNTFITPASPPLLVPPSFSKMIDGVNDPQKVDRSLEMLGCLLDCLRVEQREALQSRDVYGRMPLHYAAQYGFVGMCQIIVARMKDWQQFEITKGVDAPFWKDVDGYTPLHLSVIGGHPLTTRVLLEAEHANEATSETTAIRHLLTNSGEILALAVKSNYLPIVELLIKAGVDLNYQDDQGETALHLAARFGHTECAKILLEGSHGQKADLEITENTFGWTPLLVASVDGHFSIVELLLNAGADPGKADTSGWTAKEHAALRAHMKIANLLAKVTATVTSESDTTNPSNGAPSKSLADRKSCPATNGNGSVRVPEPVKTFGHRYLTKETMILVSLGTMDPRKAVDAFNLDNIPLTNAHTTQLDTALSVIVSANGANGEPSIIDLPVQDNISTEPIVFTAVDATKVKLFFDIVPTYAGSSEQIVGRGVALLSSIKPSIGSKRISLQGDVTVPIIAANTLEVIGSVNFNFLIITPFTHPNMHITEELTYWKSMSSTMIIGHRGLGKNSVARGSLQLGENTMQSFISAANLGATYVEFDVQLTKDHVPVIYHDFLVSETGIDAPVHTLTLEQFLHVNNGLTPRASRPPSPETADPSTKTMTNGTEARKQRSMSVGGPTKKDEVIDMSERMKYTRDFKEKGFKGNSRGNFIQEPFTTLERMFRELPESIGFNIEMKYPMLFESEEQEMDTYAVELNSFVDTVLAKVYDFGKKRHVIFSSFNPDICLLLSFKQPSIPILFLTDAGTHPVGDIRASSLQEAIRFASRWNLLGVVAAAEPFVISPRLIRVVKESGLVCVSYGTINNDPEKSNLQAKEGIDAVIVDSVLKVRNGLLAARPGPTAETS